MARDRSRWQSLVAAYVSFTEKHADAEGRYATGAGTPVVADLVAFMDRHPHLKQTEKEALEFVHAYEKSHKPQADKGQLTLQYDPSAVLVLGDKERIPMGRAKQPDLNRWFLNRSKSNRAENADYAVDQEYYITRLEKFTAPQQELHEIEVTHFGYEDQAN